MLSEKNKQITYLNVNNQISFKFDSLITSHAQVQHITNRLIHKFMHPKTRAEKDKIVLNIADQFNCNNNAGFNLTNFKVKFINQFFQDVIQDYEKSIIGTFTKGLLEKVKEKDQHELYFTITKFDNDVGFSLIHQEFEDNIDLTPEEKELFFNLNQKSEENIAQNPDERELRQRIHRKLELTKHGVIPEFIKINEIYQVYTAFTQANLKNAILQAKQAKRNEEEEVPF